MRHASPDEARELHRLLGLTEDVAAYDAMSDEIKAASEVLEAHRAQFEALIDDADAVEDRIHRLFSEEPFLPMRYTADDVHRAFEVVGYPLLYQEDAPENTEVFEAAILYVADRDRCLRLSRQLLMLLPEYVSAERYLDAWIVQYCALLLLEAPEQTNPFLAQMFYYGFVEWMEQVEAQQEGVMHELGVERSAIAGLDADEAEARIQALMADPANKARLEAYYASHPLMRHQAEAEFRELECGMVLLLGRDDADFLYLSPEEMGPWIRAFMERAGPIITRAQQAAERGDLDEPDLFPRLSDILTGVAEEMVPAIFTPVRLDHLVAGLGDYGRDLLEAGEREAAMYARAAYTTLEHEDMPAENYALLAICYASLRAMLITLSDEARARAEGRAESTERR